MGAIFKNTSIARFINFAVAIFSCFLMVACGGGGGSPGTTSGSSGVSKAAVTISLNNTSGASTNVITLSNPLIASATVLDTKGQPLPNAIVTFKLNGSNAVLAPSSATALTNYAGIATIMISIKDLSTALSQVGAADAVTANVTVGTQSLSAQAPFTFGVSTGGTKASISLELVDAAGKTTNKVTLSSPVTGRAKVTDANGQALKNATVTFALAGSSTTLTPSSGTGLTGSDGIATTTVSIKDLASALAQAGSADSLTATVTVNGQALIATTPFTIGATSITLRLVSPNSPPPNTNTVNIKSYETTSIQVDVLSDGILYTDQQVTVNFSSACAGTKADLPASATTINGRAQVVYKDKGCGTTDTVTISAAGAKSITAVVVVAPPVAASIGFVSAIPTDKAIVIKGAGGNGRTETAVLTFQALDTAGQPLPNVTVGFQVNSTQPVALQSTSAITGTDGKVTVSVNSGTQPTTFRVIASLPTGQSTISDSITVTTGQPVQAAFSLSAESSNIEGWLYDNTQTKINILMADQFGNPVADGTPVVFQADSGAIGSASAGGCLTANGGCSVVYRSQEPRFGMNNSAGKRAGLGTINVSSTSALYTLQSQIGVFLSGSFADNVYFADGTNTRVDSSTSNLYMAGCGVYSLPLELNDSNFNPLPFGTKVESVNVDKVTVQEIFPKTVPSVAPHTSAGAGTLVPGSMAARQGSVHIIPIKTPSSCVSSGSSYTETGTFGVKVTTPIGNVTVYSFSLTYPIAAPAVTCTPPQVLRNGSCVIPPSPSLTLTLSGTVVDTSTSPTVTAHVTDANGTPVINTLVTFTLSDSTLAKLSPVSGTALTDGSGNATIQLVKVIPGGQGAATVTATATVNGTSVSGSASFAIGGSSGTRTPVAINFVGAVPADKSIVIKGSGGSGRTEVALLTFNVVDSTNTGVGNVTVSFSLQTNITPPNTLPQSPSFNGVFTTTGVTDQSGSVTVALNSGTLPTTVRVIATISGPPVISALSDTVTVTTGEPASGSISLSLAKYYVEGWDIDNTANNVLVLLADASGGAVADGTQVVFTTTEGAIFGNGGAKCLTGLTNDGPGACHVTWRSQNPRTLTNLGVGTIVASATSSTGTIPATVKFYDSGSNAKVYQVGNTDSPGTTVRGAANVITLASFAGTCQAQTVRIEVVDNTSSSATGNENPMPEGTTLSAVNTANASAVVFPPTVVRNGLPIPNPNPAHRGTVHDLTVAPVGCTVGGPVTKTGFFDLAVTAPSGRTTYLRVNLGSFQGS